MIKFIENRMEKIVNEQDMKIDAIEQRYLTQFVQFK